MAKKPMRDDDAYWRAMLSKQHGQMDEAEMSKAMLEYFLEVHRTEPPDNVERGCSKGRSKGASREGDWMLDVFTYARQLKRQMKAEGRKGYYNPEAARDAAAHFKERDPYFRDYTDLERAIENGLRNGR